MPTVASNNFFYKQMNTKSLCPAFILSQIGGILIWRIHMATVGLEVFIPFFPGGCFQSCGWLFSVDQLTDVQSEKKELLHVQVSLAFPRLCFVSYKSRVIRRSYISKWIPEKVFINLYLKFLFYSYVHTVFGSFLPPSPRPLLSSPTTPSLTPPYPSLPGRNCIY
jgi:hypothetical protein